MPDRDPEGTESESGSNGKIDFGRSGSSFLRKWGGNVTALVP